MVGVKSIDMLDSYETIRDKNIVAIDPGLNDLIYCVDGEDKYANKFRYSQDQRRKETKSKKYSKIILELKNKYIEGKTIIEYETKLSKYMQTAIAKGNKHSAKE